MRTGCVALAVGFDMLLCGAGARCRAREVALVTNAASGTVSIVDTTLRQPIATIAPGVGEAVQWLTVTADGGTLFARSAGRFAIVELPAERVRASLDLPGGGGVAVVADGSRAYVGATGRIVVIDPRLGAVLDSIPVAGEVGALALDHRGESLYVTVGSSLLRIDTGTGVVGNVIQAEVRALAISPDDRTIYAVSGGMLIIFDRSMSAIESQRIFAGDLGQPVFAPDGSVVYLPLVGGGYRVIDATTRQTVARILNREVGVPFVVTADGRCAFSAGNAGSIVMIDLVTGEQLDSIALPAGSTPLALATDPAGRVLHFAACPRGVCRVDLGSRKVSTPLLSFRMLDRIAASSDGRRAVFTGSQAGVIDLPGRRLLRGLADESIYPMPSGGVAVRADASVAYVAPAVFSNLGSVARYDLDAPTGTPAALLGVSGDAVALSPDDRFAYIVSASAERLFVVDGESNQVTASVAMPGAPVDIALAADGSSAYIARAAAGDLVRVDPSTQQVSAPIGFPTASFDASRTAVDAVRGTLYTVNGSDVRSFDLTTGASAVVASLPGPLTDIALSADGQTLYVAREGSTYDGSLFFIDAATGARVDELRLFDGAPEALSVTADGAGIAIAVSPGFESNHGSLALIDATTRTAVNGIDLGRSYPMGVWVDAAGTRAYVSGCRRGTCVVDLATFSRLGDLAFFASDFAFTPDGARAFAASGTTLNELDAAGQTTRSVTLPATPTDLLLSEDGDTLFVALSDRLLALATTSLMVRSELTIDAAFGAHLARMPGGRLLVVGSPATGATLFDPAGRSPPRIIPARFDVHRLALSRDGRRAYVTGGGSLGYLWPVDLVAGRALQPIAVGGDPAGVAFSLDGATVYVADGTGNALVTVDAGTGRVSGSIALGGAPRDVAVVSIPDTRPPTPTPSPTLADATATHSPTRIRQTRTATRGAPAPTGTPTPICGDVCDGRPCGYILCPDGITFAQAACSDPGAGTCGCAPIGCATHTPTPTATLPPVADQPCGPAPPLFHGELCGSGDPCVTLSEERLPAQGTLAAAAIDSFDTLHMLFTGTNGATSRYLTRASDGEWRAEDFPGGGFLGGIAVNRRGIPFTVTQSYNDNHQELWARRGERWSIVDQVPSRSRLDLGPLLVDEGDCVHAGALLIADAASLDGYARWRESWSFATASSGGGELRTIALSPRGRPYLLARRFAPAGVDLTLTAVPGIAEGVPVTDVDVGGEGIHLAVTEDGEGHEIVHVLARIRSSRTMDGEPSFTDSVIYARRAASGEWNVAPLDSSSARSADPCGEPPTYQAGQICVEEYTTVRPVDILGTGSAVWLVFARQSFRAEHPLRCPAPRLCDWDFGPGPLQTAAEMVVLAQVADGVAPAVAIPDLATATVLLDRHGHIHFVSSEANGDVHHRVVGRASEPTSTPPPTATATITAIRSATSSPGRSATITPSARPTDTASPAETGNRSDSGGGCEATPHGSPSGVLSAGLMLILVLIRRAGADRGGTRQAGGRRAAAL